MRFVSLHRLLWIIVALVGIITAIALEQYRVKQQRLLVDNTATRQATPLDEHYFDTKVAPVLNSRCVVCHACYDAPCQLKLSSPQGLYRGANSTEVYLGSRLMAQPPSRMFIDAQTTAQWRQRGFFPVLDESSPNANHQLAVLAQLLILKQQHPLGDDALLDDSFDISLHREQSCPTNGNIGAYMAEQPLGGMPYALPALAADQHQTLMTWLSAGAPVSPAEPPSAAAQQHIAQLEAFLNRPGLKAQLTARYIYEHLFTSHLYFADLVETDTQPQFYNLVRSRTPPKTPIEVIATRRPFDDPNTAKVWYRLQPEVATIVNKTHQPYAIDKPLLAKWQQWFIDADYQVVALPSYAPEVAANPLTAFAALPVNARYRFMLERAQNTIMGYIKGPVCRGQVALNVINDRFWVFFVDPDLANDASLNQFYASQQNNLRLPAEHQSTALASHWIEYAQRQGDFLRAKNQFLQATFAKGKRLSESSIWDGDGNNDNASLTVFRHFDNATVVKGLLGEQPKTAWVIDYPLLERIHYLLVAGFDVYGNYGHQLMTRLYMDFLRMEGESNFLTFLPAHQRQQQRQKWYQKAGPELTRFLEGDTSAIHEDSGMVFYTDDPKRELLQRFYNYLAPLQPARYQVESSPMSAEAAAILTQLNSLKGEAAAQFPEITMLMIHTDSGDNALFTLVKNSAHFNVNSLFNESDNRNPTEDSVTLVHGLIGSYPDAFWSVNESQIAALVDSALQVDSAIQYSRHIDQYGVRRTNPAFWAFSDEINHHAQALFPIEAGWLDYNRLENR